MPQFTKDLIAASSFPLILSVVTEGENYGYEIIRLIQEKSNGQVVFAEGTLYPILKKMEGEGWLLTRWLVAENGRERKYYKITATGRKQLQKEKENWQSLNQILNSLWPTHLAFSNR